jgi:ZIP family zinc transporter
MTEAALWGLVTSGSLLVGALVALVFRPGTRAIGSTLAFGAGALISAVSYDLVLDAFETDAQSAALGFTLGALAFFAGDAAIDRFGGHGRKSMTGEAQASGSPLAIVLGTVLDGIPESVILGATLVEGGAVSVAFVVAVFVSNVPEAVSGTSGLLKAGWRRRSVVGLWCAVVAISTVAAAIGWLAFDQLPALDGATLLGFAAGAMLVMVADTLMPEAFEHAGRVAGLFTTLGFAVSFALTQYG